MPARPRPLRTAAGLVLVMLTAAGLAGCDGAAGPGPSDSPTRPAEEPFVLQVGDCIPADETEEPAPEPSTTDGADDPAADAPDFQGRIPVVPCDEPHRYEVFASSTLPNGGYPGDQLITEEANRLCVEEFEGFVGLAAHRSELSTTFLYPTPGSWSRGDREVLCLVTDPEGPTTGSLFGAQR